MSMFRILAHEDPSKSKILYNGRPVMGVREFRVSQNVSGRPSIELVLDSNFMVDSEIEYKLFVADINDGKLKEVESIKFKNENCS